MMRVNVITLMIWKGGGGSSQLLKYHFLKFCKWWKIREAFTSLTEKMLTDNSVTFFSLFTAVDSRSQKAVKYEFLINLEQRTEVQLLFFKFHSNYNSEVQSIKSLSFGWHFNWELFHAYNIGKKISSSTGKWGWQTVELQLHPYKSVYLLCRWFWTY